MAQTSVIHCPACRIESAAPMPQDACLYFWDCPACKTRCEAEGGRLLRVLLLRLASMSVPPAALPAVMATLVTGVVALVS
jgi:hypothetical protein